MKKYFELYREQLKPVLIGCILLYLMVILSILFIGFDYKATIEITKYWALLTIFVMTFVGFNLYLELKTEIPPLPAFPAASPVVDVVTVDDIQLLNDGNRIFSKVVVKNSEIGIIAAGQESGFVIFGVFNHDFKVSSINDTEQIKTEIADYLNKFNKKLLKPI